MFSEQLEKATGPLRIPFTNDYLFRAMLQRNNHALVSMLCSLMQIGMDTVFSAEITNPIILGDHAEDKDIIPDIRIVFNDHTFLNLKIRITSRYDQVRRSLYFLSGNGIVLDLAGTVPATTEDRLFHTDKWAKLFTATTWEEVRMLAKDNTGISEAASAVMELCEDEGIRRQCERREASDRQEGTFRNVYREKLVRVDFLPHSTACTRSISVEPVCRSGTPQVMTTRSPLSSFPRFFASAIA